MTDGGTTPYGQAALDAELAAVRSAGSGGRNGQLNKSSFAVAQLVAGEQIDASARDELIAAANDTGLDRKEIEASVASGWKAGLAQPRYPYKDAGGRVLYAKVRHDRPKQKYGYEHQDASGAWKAGRGDADPVPYRLPDLIAAPKDALIYMAEGEKQADKLASWGLVATSSKDWKGFEFSGYVRGRTVVILPDNDQEGLRIAEAAKDAVERAEGRAVIVDLPGLPPKGDVMDWAGDAAELTSLVDAALAGPDWPSLDLRACAQQSAPAREWVVAGWVPAHKATLVAGDGGVGKSLLEQMKATCVATGLPFMGLQTRRAVSAYLSWEDDADELWRRQEAICSVLGVRMADLAGQLHLVSYTEEEHPFLVTANAESGGVRVTSLGRSVERLVKSHRVGFLILDNASQIAGINHNAVEEVAPFAHWLGTIAKAKHLPVKMVTASRGKILRAEPIAALYEQGKVHHVGTFEELEDEMTMATTGGYQGAGSPDRLDALVWCLTELMDGGYDYNLALLVADESDRCPTTGTLAAPLPAQASDMYRLQGTSCFGRFNW